MFYYASDENSCSGGSGELPELEYLASPQKTTKPGMFLQSLLTFTAEVQIRNIFLLSVFKNQGVMPLGYVLYSKVLYLLKWDGL